MPTKQSEFTYLRLRIPFSLFSPLSLLVIIERAEDSIRSHFYLVLFLRQRQFHLNVTAEGGRAGLLPS